LITGGRKKRAGWSRRRESENQRPAASRWVAVTRHIPASGLDGTARGGAAAVARAEPFCRRPRVGNSGPPARSLLRLPPAVVPPWAGRLPWALMPGSAPSMTARWSRALPFFSSSWGANVWRRAPPRSIRSGGLLAAPVLPGGGGSRACGFGLYRIRRGGGSVATVGLFLPRGVRGSTTPGPPAHHPGGDWAEPELRALVRLSRRGKGSSAKLAGHGLVASSTFNVECAQANNPLPSHDPGNPKINVNRRGLPVPLRTRDVSQRVNGCLPCNPSSRLPA